MGDENQLLLNASTGSTFSAKDDRQTRSIFWAKVWTPFLLFTIVASPCSVLTTGRKYSFVVGYSRCERPRRWYSLVFCTCLPDVLLLPWLLTLLVQNCVCISFAFLVCTHSYLYPRWYTLYLSAALVGIGAGPMCFKVCTWAHWVHAIEAFLWNMETCTTFKRTIVVNSGYFFGIFQLTQVFGNLVSGYIEHAANVKTLFQFWHDNVCILLLLYVQSWKIQRQSQRCQERNFQHWTTSRILPRWEW